MSKLLYSALAGVMLSACASDSRTERLPVPNDVEVEQYNALVPYEEQIVCLMETRLGSRFKRRVCYTRGFLESRANQGQEVVDLMRQDGLLDNPLH